MFTPPPSPQPSRTGGFNTSAPIPSTELHNPENFSDSRNSGNTKRRTGRRFLWAIILVPLIVITFTVCTTSSTRLVQKSSSPHSWHGFVSDQSNWKREPEPQDASPSISLTSPVSTSTTSSSTSTTASPTASVPAASQALPTIPSSPPTLPMPFPQAFDGAFGQNFSSPSCLNFFTNMTVSMDFRQCRPFSFLLLTSSTFNKAQSNLTLMNSLIWGTCNTTLPYSQCQSNMASFASSLQTACSQELKDQNLLAVNSLIALRAFRVMHDTVCLADPTTNTYCFLNAVQDPNPSDFYFYSLPLGMPLPSSSTPSCSACSKSVMAIYATALEDPSQATLLTALKSVYQVSAQIAVGLCGAPFALTTISAAMSLYHGSPTIFMGFIFALIWMVL
ncbi:hypothetical protein BYT27DRAFT_7148459 [Phlegmacium glaucopus]|nr:hypothetical protein BYT27DRAFT_7148459 [Phlegmacium glaucopus]